MTFKQTVEHSFKTDELEVFITPSQNIAVAKIGCFSIHIEETKIGSMGWIEVGDCRVYETPNEQGLSLFYCLGRLTTFLNNQLPCFY